MKRFLLILLILVPFFSKASHIVGGEFELKHLAGNLYRLNLILYFDLANGSPGAKDPSVNVRIYRNSDNAAMRDIFMPLISETSVNYTSLVCAIGELKTNKLIYTTDIILPDADFSDPLGYYVVWERCCRNYTITNILSNPPEEGQYAGQTFYLEIPPVTKNGEPFINSTPRLFPPLSDYGCVGKPYYVDFAGTDDDGDSLVYSLVTPLNTKTGDALPFPNPPGLPRPKPYPNVTWAPGYGLGNIMHGAPDLAISADGILTVTPTKVGLFVFAVKCIEFRDGVKIGETRRDFQMLTVACPTAVAPVVKGRKLGDAAFTYRDNMTITFPYTTVNADRCIEVEITDQDIAQGSEFVAIKSVIGLGTKGSKDEVQLPALKSATLTPTNASVVFRICFDECPLKKNTPYQIGIIVGDDACALPLLDTLRITVLVETPPNDRAHFIEPVPDVNQTLFEGTSDQWPIEAADDDGDQLTLSFLTDGFNPVDYGMNLTFGPPQAGQANGSLVWDALCDQYDFSLRQNFKITLLADDADKCGYNIPDTAYINLKLINPSADPVIDTDLTPVYSERLVNSGAHKIYDPTIQFNVFGHDADPYPISLEAKGIGFNLADYGITFNPVSGLPSIQSPFSWNLNCTPFQLAKKDTFAIRFIVVDKNNKCKIYQADTLDLGFKILPPINNIPEITAQNLHPETAITATSASTFWNKPIEFRLIGTDQFLSPQRDNISIEMIDATGTVPPEGYTFTPVTGQDHIETDFIWTPDCSVFQNDVFSNDYEFRFRVFDDHCESALADTVTLTINIKDYVSSDDAFLPPNMITPNGDDVNDFFALDGYELRDNGTDPDQEIGLPTDNCVNQFEYISIYNRWGKLVFNSSNRYFRWYAPNMGAGVYYYLLKFTKKDYKSSILVRY
jgi:hypothetical protein